MKFLSFLLVCAILNLLYLDHEVRKFKEAVQLALRKIKLALERADDRKK